MRLLLLCVCLILFGCATSSKSMLPSPDKAVLVAMNDASFKLLIPLQVQVNTRIESVDGKKKSDFWTTVERLEIDSGEHSTVISCYIRRGGLHLKGEKIFSQFFDSGKVYTFKAVFGDNNDCSIILEVL